MVSSDPTRRGRRYVSHQAHVLATEGVAGLTVSDSVPVSEGVPLSRSPTGETEADPDPPVTSAVPLADPSAVSPEEIETLTYGLPAAEDVLCMLCEAESRAEQLQVIQTAWSSAGRPIPEAAAAGVLGKLNKADSRSMQVRVLQHAAAKLTTFSALDAAVRPIFVPERQLQHASKVILRATSRGLEPSAFAALLDTLLDELGRFLSAAQARELVETIAAPSDRQFRYWHVACSRVVDRWNVTESSHASGACDYGWDAAYTLKLAAACGRPLTPVALQSKVLAALGRGDPELALSSHVAEYAARIIASNTGAGTSSG